MQEYRCCCRTALPLCNNCRLSKNLPIVSSLDFTCYYSDDFEDEDENPVETPLLKALQLGSAAAAASGQLAGSSSSSSHLPLQSLAIASLWPPEGSGLLTHLSSNPEPYQALTHLDLTLLQLSQPTRPSSRGTEGFNIPAEPQQFEA